MKHPFPSTADDDDDGRKVQMTSAKDHRRLSRGFYSTTLFFGPVVLMGSCGIVWTATDGSDVVQSGRPIFDDFFQHLWPYIGNNTANVVFQMVKRLWLIRIDQ
ncbi:hypothetical protein TNCV_1250581 [Trichonephila clavipes]|nr:hypothetical protein TNCV_1250581 [Trichonephila clavipes]